MIATHLDSAAAAAAVAKGPPKAWPVRVFVRSDNPLDGSWLCLDLFGERACPAKLQQLGERSRREREAAASPAAAAVAAASQPQAAAVPLLVARFLASNGLAARGSELAAAAGAEATAAVLQQQEQEEQQLELLASSGRGLSVLEVSATPAEIKAAAQQLRQRSRWLAPSFVALVAAGEAFPPCGRHGSEPGTANRSIASGVSSFEASGLPLGLPGGFLLTVVHPFVDWSLPRCAVAGCGATVSKPPSGNRSGSSGIGSGNGSSGNSSVGSSCNDSGGGPARGASCAKLKRCGACQGPWYCSVSHQATHWRSGHARLCGHSPHQLAALLAQAASGSPEVAFLAAELRAAHAAHGGGGSSSSGDSGSGVETRGAAGGTGANSRAASGGAAGEAAGDAPEWRAGARVALVGLTAAPALNGATGVVVRCGHVASRGRVEVRLSMSADSRASGSAGKHFEVRLENLEAR
jgi:hypothetical protein